MSGVKSAAVPECYQAILASPLPGAPYLGLRLVLGQLNAIDFLSSPSPTPNSSPVEPLAAELRERLQCYFCDPHCHLPPLQLQNGTHFQQRVWGLLQQIPVGEVRTYGELAGMLGSGARAVASACRANPVPILIPCHRVVAATGLGGYMGRRDGEELEIKRWLLQHEGYV